MLFRVAGATGGEWKARLAGLEPTASASAGLRSIQTELQARMCEPVAAMAAPGGAEGGI